MKRISLGIALVFCLLVAGCSGTKSVVGKWKVSTADMKLDSKDPAAEMGKKMAESISLELKEDKTFALTMFIPFEGTWSQSGDSITLTMTKMMGKEVDKSTNTQSDKPLVLTISGDGSKLTGKDPNGKQDLVFVRA